MSIIIPLFKKSVLKEILEKYTKLIKNEAFVEFKNLETEIIKLFDRECQKCRYFEEKIEHPHERFCLHKKSEHHICEIWLCPLRK